MPKLLVLLTMLASLDALNAPAEPLERVAQSDEKSGEHSSGARLTYRETGRSESPSGELAHYALNASGLPQGKSYSLGGKWMNGRIGVIKGLHIDVSGRVLTEDREELDLALGRMFPGEFIEFILAADDGTAKASVEITRFPIEAVGNGGCRLSVKPMSINGQIFQISGSGFQPDQKIKGGSTSEGEAAPARWKTKSDGTLPKIVILPAVRGKSGGKASVTASDTSCSVMVRYHWGTEMTRAAPQSQTPVVQPTPTSVRPAEAPTPGSPGSGSERLERETVIEPATSTLARRPEAFSTKRHSATGSETEQQRQALSRSASISSPATERHRKRPFCTETKNKTRTAPGPTLRV